MCGFFQVIQKRRPINKDSFVSALNTMHHRGPDDQGVHFLDFKQSTREGQIEYHAAFGHQRLSILDLSHGSHQPFIQDDHIFLYNGELYNYKQIGADLKKSGSRLHTSGDTEVFSRALIQNGPQALSEMNGMWAFSLYNSSQHTLILSRDRYGKKPLFYYLDNDTLCLSSNIRAIQKYLGLNLEFNPDTLLEYFLFGTMHPSNSSRSHFNHISQILPGNYCTFNCKNWEMKSHPYFNPAINQQSASDHEQNDLIETLKDSVSLRLTSDRPVALLLSGGIDSSLLFSILYSEKLYDRLKIFMGDTGRSEDYEYAKKCVTQLGVPAETVVLDYDNNTFERFLKTCLHQEKAFPLNGNAMAMPQMYEAIASEGIPVVLDGTGGDEIFGGYWGNQFQAAVKESIKKRNWTWLKTMYSCKNNTNGIRGQIFNALWPNWYQNYRKTFDTILSTCLNPAYRISIKEVLKSRDPNPLANLELEFTELLYNDISPGGRLGEWIWHNDRNAMMASVENRSPLLDFRLHPFIFSGYDKKYHHCWNKYELRKAFDSFQPLPTQWRGQKQGFRWDGKHFMYQNRKQILELIESSDCLTGTVDTKKLVNIAHKFPKILKSSICKQSLCIAGIEHSLIKG